MISLLLFGSIGWSVASFWVYASALDATSSISSMSKGFGKYSNAPDS